MNPLKQNISALAGIGTRRQTQLGKLGIVKIEDFLTHFPRDYEDRTGYSSIFLAADGQKVCVRAVVASPPEVSQIRKSLSLTRLKIFDDTGAMTVTFFNNPFVKARLVQGREYVFFGAVEARGNLKSMTNPVFEEIGQNNLTGRILPIYPLTQGISGKLMMDWVGAALEMAAMRWDESLPDEILATYGLCDQKTAYESIHFPAGWDDITAARKKLIFEELFIYNCASRALKQKSVSVPGEIIPAKGVDAFLAGLPFSPTKAQVKAIDEALNDMSIGKRMNRLLQGDVGSGKTLVAAAAAVAVAKAGRQSSIMAPTELLAKQHYDSFCQMMEPHGIRCGLLVSSLPAAQKREVKRALRAGEIDILCGTHAVIQEDVEFCRAGLFVVDEQHRFGVRQRAALREKEPSAHLLVMSATPIPRTLTLILYGDLDVSVLDELPPGRMQVQTFADGEVHRQRILRFLEKQVHEGGQAYIVCPQIKGIDDSDDGRAAATEYAEQLRSKLPSLRIGLMHGKLKSSEKERVMASFAAGETDVLVSTTVVEVGVNVPNASLMIVEDADLFGLSQLHQLRGRVGRGVRQSYCILMSKDPGEVAKSRLKTLCATTDGFKIAEMDLQLRGPGDFFGSRQHGLPEFKIADMAGDTRILQQAIQAADKLFASNSLDAHPALKHRVDEIVSKSKNEGLN